MGNVLVFIILFIVVPLCIWQIYRTRSTSLTPRSHKNTASFHCVSIAPCPNACLGAKRLKGQHFLASEVSQLPLRGCNAKTCTCTYMHYDDRRQGEERRYPSGIMNSIFASNEQRISTGDRRQ